MDAVNKLIALSPSVVHCYLDNDIPGEKVFQGIKKASNTAEVRDYRVNYKGLNDFSAYWEKESFSKIDV